MSARPASAAGAAFLFSLPRKTKQKPRDVVCVLPVFVDAYFVIDWAHITQ